MIRAFIALDLPEDVRHRLDKLVGGLKEKLEGVPVRWVSGENIHLTLKFLGDVSVANVDMLQKMLKKEVETHPPFEISIGGIGAYPNTRHSRVIWAGVEAPQDLYFLHRGIDAVLATLGYGKEERPFSPHLTLGRVSRNATPRDSHAIGSVLESMKVGFLGVAHMDAVHLYKSDLKPSGSVYTRLFTAALKR